MAKFAHIIQLLRPAQWIKNTFVFLPMFLNGELTEYTAVVYSAMAFLMFCLTSSAIYCINDAIDAPYDAVNPDKCNRPVASGALSRSQAIVVAGVLIIVVALVLLLSGNIHLQRLLIILGVYFLLNILYSFWLKAIPVVDVLLISCCFLLRIYAGGVACGIHLTLWTLLLVFLLTLMLATGKRRHEAWLSENMGVVSRSNIKHYNVAFLNVMLIIMGTASFGVYLGWTLSDYAIHRFNTHLLFLTSIFVAQGIGRYLWIILKDNKGGNPTLLLLRDRIIQAAVVLWLLCFSFILYF